MHSVTLLILLILLLIPSIGLALYIWTHGLEPDHLHALPNLLGILIGAFATVFALIAGTAVLLFQQISNNAPTSLQFFPVGQIVNILVGLLALLIADSTLYLIGDYSAGWLAMATYAVLALHVVAGSVVVWFVESTRRWLDPKETVNTLVHHINRLSKFGPTIRESRRISLLNSLNELASTFIEKRHSSTVTPLLRAYRALVLVQPAPPRVTDDGSPTFPVRLSKSLAQFCVNLSANQLETYIPDVADAYMDLLLHATGWLGPDSVASKQKEALKFLTAIDRLQSELIIHNQQETLAEFLYKVIDRASKTASTTVKDRQMGACVLAELFLRSLRLAITRHSTPVLNVALQGLEAEDRSHGQAVPSVRWCAQQGQEEAAAFRTLMEARKSS